MGAEAAKEYGVVDEIIGQTPVSTGSEMGTIANS
jgi:hypothetical protein